MMSMTSVLKRRKLRSTDETTESVSGKLPSGVFQVHFVAMRKESRGTPFRACPSCSSLSP